MTLADEALAAFSDLVDSDDTLEFASYGIGLIDKVRKALERLGELEAKGRRPMNFGAACVEPWLREQLCKPITTLEAKEAWEAEDNWGYLKDKTRAMVCAVITRLAQLEKQDETTRSDSCDDVDVGGVCDHTDTSGPVPIHDDRYDREDA